MKNRLLSLIVFLLPSLVLAQLNTIVTSTDISCFGDSNGTATVIGNIPGAGPPVVISEIDLGSTDWIELTNVSGAPVNTTGWFLCVSESPYSNINTVNSNVWNLPTTVPAGWVDFKTDGATNPWGSNLFWNPGNWPTYSGWALLSDNLGNIVDFVAWQIPENEILNTFSVTTQGFTFDITPAEWTGDGIDGNCTQTLRRNGNSDNDDASDFSCTTGSQGLVNPSLTLPFTGVGLSVEYLWSTGDTTSTITDLGPGTYTVTTTGNNTTVIDTVVITEPPLPPFDIPFEDTVVCTGNALLVDAGPGWNSYDWSNGNISQTTIITQPGTYSITITDSNNCPAVDSFNVSQGVTPEPNLGGDTTICADEWLLDAGFGVSYIWNTGGTSSTWTATQSGNYAVTVTSNDGCIGVADVDLTLYPVPDPDLGDDFVLCYNFNQTAFLNTGGNFSIYQWSDGSSNSVLLVGSGVNSAGNQNYSVTVTDNNGCTASDTVRVTYANCVGTGEEPSSDAWTIFPNPANDFVVINAQQADALERIEIMDVTGKLVLHKAVSNNSTSTRLDLSEIEAGTYFIRLYGGDQEQTIRCVKH